MNISRDPEDFIEDEESYEKALKYREVLEEAKHQIIDCRSNAHAEFRRVDCEIKDYEKRKKMSDDKYENCLKSIDRLERSLIEKKHLFGLATNVFLLLLEFCDDDQEDTREWVLKIYQKVLQRGVKGFSKQLSDAKQGIKSSFEM